MVSSEGGGVYSEMSRLVGKGAEVMKETEGNGGGE